MQIKHPLTCLTGTYNEAARLTDFLAHATQWADEVVIVDKSSTDNTRELAEDEGAVVHVRPFTPQGHEDMVDRISCAANDWVFLMTPGEVPTRELIHKAKAAIDNHGDTVDIITIPKKLYSFGIHDPASPWSVGQQPMLFNRQRAVISNRVHANFSLRPGGKCLHIPYSETCHVFHPTHATVNGFLRSHFDYILAEAAGQDPQQLRAEALRQIASHDFGGHKPALFGQECAWKLYWLGCLLAGWEKQQARDVPRQYAKQTKDLINQEWLIDYPPSLDEHHFTPDSSQPAQT